METGDEQRPTGETAFGGQTGDELSWQTTNAKLPYIPIEMLQQ